MAYAADTAVSVEKSRIEIERTLIRYGADAFAYGTDGPQVKIAFRMHGKQFRFELTLPGRTEKRFTEHSRGARSPEATLSAWEQACRQKWRALALVIKAKLEAVEAKISTLEDEFLAHLVLPNGQTMGDWAKPEIEEAYRVGHMPKTLMLEDGRR
jgi:hypothetical protein